MNEVDQNNIDEGEERGEASNKVQNQGGNINNHAEISDNEGWYNSSDDNNYDLDNNNQPDYNSINDSGNENNVEESDNENNRDPNNMGKDEENTTTRRRNHSMNTQLRK